MQNSLADTESSRGQELFIRLFDQHNICSNILALLPLTTKVVLTQICVPVYFKIQKPLYNKIAIHSYCALYKLARTARAPAKLRNYGTVTKDISRLYIELSSDDDDDDDHDNGPTAVSLSIVMGWLRSSCTNIEIFLNIQDKFCHQQPIASFADQSFPGVQCLRIIPLNQREFTVSNYLYTVANLLTPGFPGRQARGISSSSFQVIPQRRSLVQNSDDCTYCKPRVGFWCSLLDGKSFPDMKVLIIDHEPISKEEILCLGKQLLQPIQIWPNDIQGVRLLRFLNINFCPELNDSVLRACLPWIEGLKVLRLHKNPGLTYSGISSLLHRVLPNLNVFDLEIADTDISAEASYECFQNGLNSIEHPHLCPLIRRFTKHIQHVNISMPYLCSDIILTNPKSQLRSKYQDIMNTDGGRKNYLRVSEGCRCARAFIAEQGSCRGAEDGDVVDLAIFAASNYRNVSWILGYNPGPVICIPPDRMYNHMMTKHQWEEKDELIVKHILASGPQA